MGQSQTIRTGVTAYVNPGGSTPAMDSAKSDMVTIRADNAIALTMSGVAMALAAMQFWKEIWKKFKMGGISKKRKKWKM